MHFEMNQTIKGDVLGFTPGRFLHTSAASFLPTFDFNSAPLIHDGGTAGSPEIIGWVRYFPLQEGLSQPASRKLNIQIKTLYLVFTGPEKQAGDQISRFIHHS